MASPQKRDLRHLVNIVHDLTEAGVGLKVLTGKGVAIDTTTASGKLVFGIFAALAEFERELISERTIAGLAWPPPVPVEFVEMMALRPSSSHQREKQPRPVKGL